LVEGWKSVNTDPTNNSAHRFLADSYAARPRHEIARVSELLQSQLLQSTNITPIQPRLAESNLFLISSLGPGSLSFNEFNPIFNRDRIALQATGIAGENDTYAGEVVASGIYRRFSFSAGYTHFETDGWRDENSDQEDDIVNAFAQLELGYKTSIQAEYKYRDTEYGDIVLRFFEDDGDFKPNETTEEEIYSYRLGARHAFSPGSILIGNFMFQNKDSKLTDEPTVFFINSAELEADDEEALSGELQYLFRSEYINIVSGAGYFDIDRKEEQTLSVIFPPFTIEETFDKDVNHANVYLYSYINLPGNATLTAGGSYDDFDTDSSDEEDEEQFNPKFGITWNPAPSTTVRAAVTRVLKRTLITDQTLEPTQVAGFNQFYDDFNATEAWIYGGAIDQKFTNFYWGGELSYRDLSVPFQDAVTGNVDRTPWEEYLGRAYFFLTPHEWLSLSAEYRYERIERTDAANLGIKTLDTHRVPLGINFFHPSGLSASLKPTYFYQDGKFEKLESPAAVYDTGDDSFLLVDASINYRFPKRYGFFTLGVTNLFDEDFEYAEIDINNAEIQPDRTIFGRVTLALP
jgi:outer membrane receptor protein involved in Fe transport